MEEKRKLTRKQAQPKYTKDVNENHKFKGWSRKGIRRYNKLIIIVRRNRNTAYSKEVEVKLMNNYKEICGKMHSGNSDDDESDSDISDDDSFEAYDGFAGESTGENTASEIV